MKEHNRILNILLKDGFEEYKTLPDIRIDVNEGCTWLVWDLPSEKMEIRVRFDDGKINWYYIRQTRCGGNEGWSSYRPSISSLTPWPKE